MHKFHDPKMTGSFALPHKLQPGTLAILHHTCLSGQQQATQHAKPHAKNWQNPSTTVHPHSFNASFSSWYGMAHSARPGLHRCRSLPTSRTAPPVSCQPAKYLSLLSTAQTILTHKDPCDIAAIPPGTQAAVTATSTGQSGCWSAPTGCHSHNSSTNHQHPRSSAQTCPAPKQRIKHKNT